MNGVISFKALAINGVISSKALAMNGVTNNIRSLP
jgi:hypothetical protein